MIAVCTQCNKDRQPSEMTRSGICQECQLKNERAKEGARQRSSESIARRRPLTLHVTQNFTENGIIGVWLFITSPFLTGIALYWLLEAYNPVMPLILLMACGFASLAGMVLMLIGRSQTIERVAR